jgi:predicted amidohydrolase
MAVPAHFGRTSTRGTPRSAIVSTILLGLLVDVLSQCGHGHGGGGVTGVSAFTVTVFQPVSTTLTPKVADHMAALQVAVQAAAAAGSDMVVCPELYATGYTASAVLHAEPRHGPSYTAAQRFARESNISLLFTYAEEGSDGAKYDAAALFYRTGATLADYRKVNLAAGEAAFLTPGTAFAPVVVVDGVRVGVMICFDIFLPEPARLLALQKVDLLLVPTANGYPPSVYNQLTQLIVPTRGLENNAFVVYNNWCVDMPRPWPWPPPSTATAYQLSHRPCIHSMRVGHVAGTVRGAPALTPTTVSATRSESDSQVPGQQQLPGTVYVLRPVGGG